MPLGLKGDGRTSEIVSVVQDSVWSVEEYTITPSPGATKIVMIEMGDDRIKVFHDEVEVLGPVTRYGLFNLGDTKISLSNIIGGGHVIGAGSIGQDGIVIMTSPSGQISGKIIATTNPDKGSGDDGGFLELLLSPLGDTQQEKMVALAAIGGVLFLMFVSVIVVLRRSHREEEELEVRETGDLELLVETEEDDGPLVAIDTDGESDLVVSTAPVNVILEEEEEEPTLSDELKAKVEAGNASKRPSEG